MISAVSLYLQSTKKNVFPSVITVHVCIIKCTICSGFRSSLQFTMEHKTYKLYALWEWTVLPVFLRKPLKNATLTLTLSCREMNISQLKLFRCKWSICTYTRMIVFILLHFLKRGCFVTLTICNSKLVNYLQKY